MDIVAHGLWAGIGVAVAAQRWEISPGTAVATVAMAVLPDLAQLLPMQGGALFEKDRVAVLSAYATSSPGTEPAMSPLIALFDAPSALRHAQRCHRGCGHASGVGPLAPADSISRSSSLIAVT